MTQISEQLALEYGVSALRLKDDGARRTGGGPCAEARPAAAVDAAPEGAPATCSDCDDVADMIDCQRPLRKRHTLDVAAALSRQLAAAGIDAEVSSRIKSPCSAQEKMRRQGLALTELHDVCGVRVVVDEVAACYRALDTVHDLWPHLPEALDDYIAHPKDNGYQSLHTVVRLPCSHTLEIQIRSRQQHRMAERGAAAHWRYKRGHARQPDSARGEACPVADPSKPRR